MKADRLDAACRQVTGWDWPELLAACEAGYRPTLRIDPDAGPTWRRAVALLRNALVQRKLRVYPPHTPAEEHRAKQRVRRVHEAMTRGSS